MTVASQLGKEPSFFVDERAFCESDEIGPGTHIWAFAHIRVGARIGAQCNIGESVILEPCVLGDGVRVKHLAALGEHTVVEDDVFIGPGAMILNDRFPRTPTASELGAVRVGARLKRACSIGSNATVLGGITVGAYAMVGAGSVVTHDVPDHAIVVGNPARQNGWACHCGTRLSIDLRCARCAQGYVLIGEDRIELKV